MTTLWPTVQDQTMPMPIYSADCRYQKHLPKYHTILLMDTLEGTPVTVSHIRNWTARDQVLSTVLQKVQKGWKGPTDDALQPYARRKNKLSVQDGCLLWGNRVVVPPRGRSKVIDELHEGHPGMTRMKQLARSFVWWPSIWKRE